MSTHTTYFCDHCNYDRDISNGDDDGHAISHDGLPTYSGWAEFNRTREGTFSPVVEEMHVCAHCLADPDFEEPAGGWAIPKWDTQSQESYDKGRQRAARFAEARDLLGPRTCQTFGSSGRQFGPLLEDGEFLKDREAYYAWLRKAAA